MSDDKARFDQRAVAGAAAMADALLKSSPEIRSVSVVFDWEIRSDDLPGAVFRSRRMDRPDVAYGGMLESLAKAAASLMREVARWAAPKDGGSRDLDGTQGKDDHQQLR